MSDHVTNVFPIVEWVERERVNEHSASAASTRWRTNVVVDRPCDEAVIAEHPSAGGGEASFEVGGFFQKIVVTGSAHELELRRTR